MNFHELMAKAAQNQESKKAQVATVKRYNTAIPPPKKEVKQKGISPNVRAFLAKKEEEAKKKVVEQKKYREKYLDKSKQCYRKVQNIHELIKEDKDQPEEKELDHITPTSNKTAEEANCSFNGTSSGSKPGTKSDKVEKSDTAKKKRKGNAPTFAELMKLAAEKKTTVNDKTNNARPMTAKEKEELERSASHKKTKEYRIWAEYGPSALEKYKAQQRLKENGGKPPSDSDSSPGISKPVEAKPVNKDSKNSPVIPKSGTKRTSNGSPVCSSASNDRTISGGKQGRTKTVVSPPPPKASKYVSTNENVLVCRPAEQGMSAWDRVYNHRRPPPRGDVTDSESEESEYDDEDGFIDDGPLVDPYANTISNEIRSIFGYDRRKYKDCDEDDRNMETSFREQMKEEARSARLGMKEDLEDIRREEEELKRKQALKKKR